MNRKHFLKLSGSAALGMAVTSCGNSSQPVNKSNGTISNLGLQLYSLRDDLPKDPKGILKQVASFGYKEIESFEGDQGIFWGMPAKDFKKYMDELGIKITSSHCDHKNDFERKASEAGEIGMEYLFCPFIGKQKTADDYKKIAEDFNKAGEICKKNGLRFGYHNHDYSFREEGGQFPQDILMQNTEPSLVDFEMDIYWVVVAGQDPVAWMNKYKNRFTSCHIKDRRKSTPYKEGEENQSCIVGKGSIDYKSILSKAKNLGLKKYILEQEAYEKTPLECVKEGAAYLNQLQF